MAGKQDHQLAEAGPSGPANGRASSRGSGVGRAGFESSLGAAAGVITAGCAAVATFAWTGRLSLVAAVLALCATGIAFLVRARVLRTFGAVGALREAAQRVTQGGRLERIEAQSLGHLAPVGESFNQIFDSLGDAAHRVLGIVDRVRTLPPRITEAMGEIQASSEAQEEAVEETASLLANMNSSIRGINDRVDTLSRSAEESASSILEMGSSVDEVARNSATLHEVVEASTSAVHEMSASIRQVAHSAETVQAMAEESASSMTEMDRALQEVGTHVRHALELSETVSASAEEGSRAVSATIEDTQQIWSLSRDAKTRLEQLVMRIGEIAEILGVIGDINDEANLLSLNAAIIAAQAGEQGKAFLVVANHVKTLAQRTATSTKDIERLIQTVQSESDTAVAAMGAGIGAVEQGVDRARRAGDALTSIRESAEASNTRVAEIARTSEEQARNSKLVARAAQETSLQVHQITTAMAEQSAASEKMLKSSERGLEMCRQVHRSTEEQRETGRYITGAISSITEMIREIQGSTAQHGNSSHAVAEAVTLLLDNARKASKQIPEIHGMLGELLSGSESIMDELARFEISRNRFED